MAIGVQPGDGFAQAHLVKEAVSLSNELLASLNLDKVVRGHYIGNIGIGSFADGVQVSAGHCGTGTSLQGALCCNKVSLGQSEYLGVIVTEVNPPIAREFVEPRLGGVVLRIGSHKLGPDVIGVTLDQVDPAYGRYEET